MLKMIMFIKEAIIYRESFKCVNYFDIKSEMKKIQLNKRRYRKYSVNTLNIIYYLLYIDRYIK